MAEIEVKVLDIDVSKIRKTLLNQGAKLIKKENQINHMYDFEDGKLDKQKGYARIREIDDLLNNKKRYVLCVKKMISQEKYKSMLEEETEVINFEACDKILKELGLGNLRSDKKYRESYSIGNVLYEIDTWDESIYPKPYLEVEAANEEDLQKGLNAIGYDLKDATSKTLKELKAELTI